MVQQFQWLGFLMVTFLVLAAFMVFWDGRTAAQISATSATATEMEMLSQRLARGTALAAQGQVSAFATVRDSRDRFRANLDGLMTGGAVKGVNIDKADDDAIVKDLDDLKTRWDRVEASANRVIDNQTALTTLAKGLDAISQGNNAILELSQQVAQQVGQAGGTLREIEYSNQLAVLSQRIAKNANALASSDEIDPEVAFLLNKDVGTMREVLNGLLKGSDTLRLTAIRNEDARATLDDLQKRYASYESGVGAILANMNRLVAAKQAARSINAESEALLTTTTSLANAYEGNTRMRRFTLGAVTIFGALSLIFLVLMGKVVRRRACPCVRERTGEQARPEGDCAVERDRKPGRRRSDRASHR